MTEQELVHSAQKGDTSAFGQLVEAHQSKIYSLCYRMTGNAEDAADLTQEVFLSAWRSRFQEQSSFGTWIYRMATNASIDFLRREKRRQVLSMTMEEDSEERQAQVPDERYSPHRLLEQKEARQAVADALAALSPEHRQVLVLREIQQLRYDEIGKALELDIGTVKSRIARARLALRDFLIKSGNFSAPPPSK